LYEILTGVPPHTGRRLIQILHSVSQSAPHFPESAPPELAAIAKRAMAKHPDDRFASADELRLAIADFLRHRGSIELTEQAEARLSELEAAAQSEDAKRRALFAEARFGFAQALRSWPDNERAMRGQRDALRSMIAHELAQGDPRAAARLLEELI